MNSNNRIYYSSEAEKMAKRQKMVLLTLVAGLSVSIGAALALLFAPESGEKIRQQIGDQMGDAVEKARAATETASDQLRENADKVREDLNERVQSLRD